MTDELVAAVRGAIESDADVVQLARFHGHALLAALERLEKLEAGAEDRRAHV